MFSISVMENVQALGRNVAVRTDESFKLLGERTQGDSMPLGVARHLSEVLGSKGPDFDGEPMSRILWLHPSWARYAPKFFCHVMFAAHLQSLTL